MLPCGRYTAGEVASRLIPVDLISQEATAVQSTV